MNFTKGHNNFDKAQRVNKLHMWMVCNEINIWLWIGISNHRGTLLYFCVFENEILRISSIT